MSKEALKKMYQLLLTEPHAPTVCAQLEEIAREALAQPEQEPVAWGRNRYIEDDNGFQIGTDEPELAWGKYAPDDNGWWPLSLYTSPPQRTWVGLTDEQVIKTFNAICNGKPFNVERILELHRAIEAKLKEKNT